MTGINNRLSQLHCLMGADQLATQLMIRPRILTQWLNGIGMPPEKPLLAKLDQWLMCMTKPALDPNAAFTFIDLFAGIGGFRQGFEAIGGQCIFSSEQDRFSQQTYRANFRDGQGIAGDIRQVNPCWVPAHDLLLAGFPCQPFSTAGVSKRLSQQRSHGFACQQQGDLFFEIIRILKAKKPSVFLLENVKNLLYHNQGKTFARIRSILTKTLGYQVFHTVIDADGFVPQHRERLFIAGFADPQPFCWSDYPLPTKGRLTLKTILHPENGDEPAEFPTTTGKKARVCSRFMLSKSLWRCLKAHKKKHQAKGHGFGYSTVTGASISRTLSARYGKDGAEILVSRGDHRTPRRLTPRECARLMGYADTFKIPVSVTQRYRQFGHSVVVPLVKVIAGFMQPCLMRAIEKKPMRV